ncbi:anthranilate synthase component I family protein [Xylanibacillus composti]|nr:anthranilate synthase component I family protein [Xylanibacillus composti]MDT9725111.1 anthranilate synthase component I family protein [Xylanibacillus composti]
MEDGYTALPYVEDFPLLADGSPDSWEAVWKEADSCHVLLESGKGGRYTFLGANPVSVIRGKGDRAIVTDLEAGEVRELTGSPLALTKQWLSPHRSPRLHGLPPWLGGAAGYWAYDVVRSIERLPVLAEDDLGLPDYVLFRFNEVWIIDQQESRLFCSVHGSASQSAADLTDGWSEAAARVQRMKTQWERWCKQAKQAAEARRLWYREQVDKEGLHIDVDAMEGILRAFPKSDYEEAVRRIQAYIAQGDVFQVNLSLRQSRELAASPQELYEWLRLLNPSPYMGYFNAGNFQLVSASPELLVKRQGNVISTRPIAGTRRRGQNEAEDARMREELLATEKERAEHVMLVDLERNDLGRISRYGTVRVDDFMVIEQYSHVMHLVSEVRGELAEGKDSFDVLAATFPGGTITGAPKIRTMEIIEELEPVRRGPYTGSLGWIDYNGDMEFNILIRTLVASEGIGHIQAGAGIVIDSIPHREYQESIHKAKALWKAIQYSEQFAAWQKSGLRHKGGAMV